MARDRRSGAGALYEAGELIPGTKLRVERYVGGGGMGSVYAAIETSVQKRYVVKIIHPSLLASAGASERMMQEATTLANLEHKNIVQVYWAGLTDETPPLAYYVMECLRGYPLRHALAWHTSRGLELPLTWFFHIASGLLLALGHAHENRIIHRDVKPDNIFIHMPQQGGSVVKLLDFGILAVLSETSRTTSGHFTGTLSYAAPEQLRGERPTPAIDIYAAGLVMYEMLASRAPFGHHTHPHALIHAQLNEPPPPLATKRSVHPELVALVRRMLEKDPARRPAGAGEVVSALARIQTDWLGRGAETFAGDAGSFQFDADIGPLWETNAGPAEALAQPATRTAPVSDHALEPPPAALPDGQPLADQPATDGQWGGTVTGRSAARRSRFVLAAVGLFVGLSIGLVILLRPYAAPSVPASPSSAPPHASESPEAAAQAATPVPAAPEPQETAAASSSAGPGSPAPSAASTASAARAPSAVSSSRAARTSGATKTSPPKRAAAGSKPAASAMAPRKPAPVAEDPIFMQP